ncbi:MAG: YjbQ family protein [Candidatus Heimdallarchaeota archaeon]|nr:YjbQ family protein [Candidatus Heimdallarchaeota archaeon]
MNILEIRTNSLNFNTSGEFDFIDLTSDVDQIVQKSGIQNGIALVFAGHSTGVIVIAENEPHLRKDIKEFLQQLIPSTGKHYHHSSNAFAHLRSMFLTPSKVIPVVNGKIALGTWQSVLWIEADQRTRNRKVEVYVIGK